MGVLFSFSSGETNCEEVSTVNRTSGALARNEENLRS